MARTSSWERIKLGPLLRVKHGWAFRGEHFRDRGDYVVLTPGHFQPGGGMKSRDREKFYLGDFPTITCWQRAICCSH